MNQMTQMNPRNPTRNGESLVTDGTQANLQRATNFNNLNGYSEQSFKFLMQKNAQMPGELRYDSMGPRPIKYGQ